MTRRNNEERLGVKKETPEPPLHDMEESNAFSFVTPTEVVDLPSRGEFYPPGHPLYQVDAVEIRYMTAKEEDILTSRSLLKKGLAVDRLLQNVIVDKNIRVDDLLVGDKNALIVASRITGYGREYNVNVTCPFCGANQEHLFDLHAAEHKFPENLEELGVTKTDSGTFLIELPKTKLNAEVRLLTGKDEKDLSQREEKRKKLKLDEETLTGQLKKLIVSVNGNTDAGVINDFVENMPAADSRHLRNVYADITPNVNLDREITCQECGVENEIVIPFSAQFFWPK